MLSFAGLIPSCPVNAVSVKDMFLVQAKRLMYLMLKLFVEILLYFADELFQSLHHPVSTQQCSLFC